MALGRFWDFVRTYKYGKTKIGGKVYDYKYYVDANGKGTGSIDVLLIDGKLPPWFQRYYTSLSTDPIALQLRAASASRAVPGRHGFREDRTSRYRQQLQKGFHASIRPGKRGKQGGQGSQVPQTAPPELPVAAPETPLWVWIGGGAALVGTAYLLTRPPRKEGAK